VASQLAPLPEHIRYGLGAMSSWPETYFSEPISASA
jgi:hypothetical protein